MINKFYGKISEKNGAKWIILPSSLFRRLSLSNIKMISCERIDQSEGGNFKKEGSECMICHY